ncbi:MAG: hypothetical protein H6767_00490 [Candidatus Peribacteria bacterium]|nr:MAG: hypothetical protein H6767_00490 [Candidatus Peribacteria bacterium]
MRVVYVPYEKPVYNAEVPLKTSKESGEKSPDFQDVETQKDESELELLSASDTEDIDTRITDSSMNEIILAAVFREFRYYLYIIIGGMILSSLFHYLMYRQML